MTRAEFLARFPHASEATIRRNLALFDGFAPHERTGGSPVVDSPPRPVVEPIAGHAPVKPATLEAAYSGRVRVTVTSHRCGRLCDPDNVAPKYFIDCLRTSGLIRDDSRAEIELRVHETRVPKKAQEGCEIIIEPMDG